jgi:hypothetical protein
MMFACQHRKLVSHVDTAEHGRVDPLRDEQKQCTVEVLNGRLIHYYLCTRIQISRLLFHERPGLRGTGRLVSIKHIQTKTRLNT